MVGSLLGLMLDGVLAFGIGPVTLTMKRDEKGLQGVSLEIIKFFETEVVARHLQFAELADILPGNWLAVSAYGKIDTDVTLLQSDADDRPGRRLAGFGRVAGFSISKHPYPHSRLTGRRPGVKM